MNELLRSIVGLATLAAMTCNGAVRAATFGGGTIVDISDGTSHGCIDVSANLVSMQLAVIQVDRQASWWSDLIKKKKSLGVKFDVNLTDSENKPFNFPRAKQLNPPPGSGGVAALPMQISIMSKYHLTAGPTKEYVNIGMDVYFITVEEKSDAAKVLTSLADFTKSLPIPVNPYSAGINYFGDFVNKLVTPTLQGGAHPDPDASFTFDLAASAAQVQACRYGYLKEGVQAVIFDPKGTPDANTVGVGSAAGYCFWFDPSANRVRFAPRSGTCAVQADTSAKQLNNPLIAFVVSAVPIAPSPATLQGIRGIQGIQSNVTSSLVTKSFSDSEIKSALPGSSSPLSGRISAGAVGDLLKLFDQRVTTSAGDAQRVADHSTNQDVATATALRRCAAAGIPAAECI